MVVHGGKGRVHGRIDLLPHPFQQLALFFIHRGLYIQRQLQTLCFRNYPLLTVEDDIKQLLYRFSLLLYLQFSQLPATAQEGKTGK